ncbi:MAG: NAD(P)H-dependent oxidoreductase [Alphaproteobacteria bacterium]|nr:NAD(P)H-dependent oxidoreductase [Alphaproteobacteria bacterium]
MANILLVYGHPKTPKSFNFDLKERLVATLKNHGHNVLVRDLYEISFNPLLSSKDLELIHNKQIPDDIKKEQEFIRNADVIIFIYPIWWAGQPAIIKGYIDRVFSYGFAYMYKGGKVVGLLPDKKAIIINSNGNSTELYEREGFYDAMRLVVDKGIFAFCGFSKVKHLFYGSQSTKTDDEKNKDINNAIDETIIEIEATDKN